MFTYYCANWRWRPIQNDLTVLSIDGICCTCAGDKSSTTLVFVLLGERIWSPLRGRSNNNFRQTRHPIEWSHSSDWSECWRVCETSSCAQHQQQRTHSLDHERMKCGLWVFFHAFHVKKTFGFDTFPLSWNDMHNRYYVVHFPIKHTHTFEMKEKVHWQSRQFVYDRFECK